MIERRPRAIVWMAVTLPLAGLAPLSAQSIRAEIPERTNVKTLKWDKSWGNSTAGCSVQLYGYAKERVQSEHGNTAFTKSVRGQVTGNVKLLGKKAEAARVDAFACAWRGRFRGSGAMRWFDDRPGAKGYLKTKLGGHTVFSKEFSNSFAESDSWKLTIFKKSATFRIGPVPVRVKGRVRAVAEVGIKGDVEKTVLAQSARLSGFGRGRATGDASASVGAGGYEAGIKSTLNFADTTANYDFTSADEPAGKFDFAITPIKFVLKAFVKLGWPINRKWSKTLIKQSWGSTARTIRAR